MNRERLDLALERIQPDQWAIFEKFASSFLSAYFDNLRTLATPSGDKGRDAELFSPAGEPTVLFQYSVTKIWKRKIVKTAERISENFKNTKVLIYVTNQLIGAEADDCKDNLRKQHGLILDLRDRTWFLDRFRDDHQREAAAEKLAKEIVDPYLSSKGIIESKGRALTGLEARAALVYLTLQWEDDIREKGLTKLCFDALVRAVLRNTNSDHRMSRQNLLCDVRKIVPDHPAGRVDAYTNSSLKRLTKRYIRHWPGVDEFCLTYEESTRLRSRLTEIDSQQFTLMKEISQVIARQSRLDPETDQDLINEASLLTKDLLERFLLSRGELFAQAVRTGNLRYLGIEGLRDLVIKELSERELEKKMLSAVGIVWNSIEVILKSPSDAIEGHIRSLADAYTIFAFLRQTPDVQSAVSKIFSHGEIWLDTTVVLPALAEELIGDPNRRRFGKMLRIAADAGIELRVTSGVIEEVERHINRTFVCHGIGKAWEGSIPFLYSCFIETGRSRTDFPNWLKNFRGEVRPEQDIADYLQMMYSIIPGNLIEEMRSAPDDIRAAVQEVWFESHERRRQRRDYGLDDITIHRLVEHDVENYLGVIQKRTQEKRSPLGYSTWWLTFDRTAFSVRESLRNRIVGSPPASPVLSADFLVNYLAIGPIRRRVSKPTESSLPLIVDFGLMDYLTPELLSEAEKIRQQSHGLPEHVIRRNVRDRLDTMKAKIGPEHRKGMDAVREEILRTGPKGQSNSAEDGAES